MITIIRKNLIQTIKKNKQQKLIINLDNLPIDGKKFLLIHCLKGEKMNVRNTKNK